MIVKLIDSMVTIVIGHRSKIIIIGFFLLIGCRLWEIDDSGDYWYMVKIENSTSDTLKIIFGQDLLSFENTHSINPNSQLKVFGMKVYKGEKVITEKLFCGGFKPFEEQLSIYRNDTLKIQWYGPAQYMNETFHHFYNYNSWESWLEDNGRDGIVLFTIYESDLIGNTK